MNLSCDEARALVPSYLDNELSEGQAAPLRQHLLACHECREAAQAEKALKRWFVPSAAVAVPAGFAAEVARRACAPQAAEPALVPSAAQASQDPLQTYVLWLTALAASALIALSAALRVEERPSGDALRADELPAMLQELEHLNQRDAGPNARAGAPTTRPAAPVPAAGR